MLVLVLVLVGSIRPAARFAALAVRFESSTAGCRSAHHQARADRSVTFRTSTMPCCFVLLRTQDRTS